MKLYFKWILALFMAVFFQSVSAADATLGPGDTLRINVFGQPDLSLETKVAESGNITYPLIGQVKVGGMTPADAGRKIAGMLESGGYLKKPQVTVAVAQNQSQQVSVLGNVTRPGRYPVDANQRNLTDIIALAGGMTQDAGDKVTITRVRNGKTTREVLDLRDVVEKGSKKDLQLSTGDTIFVERAPRFYITGSVNNPGAYKLERNMTVLQALAVGGGVTPRGTDRGVKLKRKGPDGTLQEITAKHDDLVQVDDVVYVRESLF